MKKNFKLSWGWTVILSWISSLPTLESQIFKLLNYPNEKLHTAFTMSGYVWLLLVIYLATAEENSFISIYRETAPYKKSWLQWSLAWCLTYNRHPIYIYIFFLMSKSNYNKSLLSSVLSLQNIFPFSHLTYLWEIHR